MIQKKEIIWDNKDKIKIKKYENKLTEENNDIEIYKNKENNIVKNEMSQEKEIVETEENNSNQSAIDDIFKNKNFSNDTLFL